MIRASPPAERTAKAVTSPVPTLDAGSAAVLLDSLTSNGALAVTDAPTDASSC
jgi:hypothetical protein